MNRLIVSDSSPLIYFSKVGKLRLLEKLYDEIVIPEAVYAEVVIEAREKPGVNQIKRAKTEGWLKLEKVATDIDFESEGIEKVDAEVISLARKLNAPLLTNDRALAVRAKSHGVSVKWLTLVLIDAVRQHALSPEEAQRVLIDLVRAGLRVRSEVIVMVLKMIDEYRGRQSTK